jgi:hypothetical protein
MRYTDLDTSEFRKQMTAGVVVAETSKRGATVKLPIQFVRDAVVIELEDIGENTPATVTLGFKAPAGYDSVAYVIDPVTAQKSGTGTSTVYTFTIPFLSAQLDQLFSGNLDEVILVPEIKWASLTENGETLAFDWVVQNNVQRGGESVPAFPVTSVTTRLPQVVRLAGGKGTDLDTQLLAGFADGTVFEVVTYDATLDGRVESRWEKDNTREELVTDVLAGVIICQDGTKLFRV